MNRTIKIFGYELQVIPILVVFFCYLIMEDIFSWLLVPNSMIVLAFDKGLSLVILGLVLFNFTNLTRNEKIYTGLFCFLIIRLIFESLLSYGTFFQEFTMYTVLFPVIYTIFIKCVCRTLELNFLEFLAKFYIMVYIIFMVIYGRGFNFSLDSVDMTDYGPFSGDSRIIHAKSILMMIIPLLWYLSQFLKTFRLRHFLPFVFCFVVILIHQHRSVWASSVFALFMLFVLSYRNRLLTGARFFYVIVATCVLIMVSGVVVYQVSPKFMDLLADRSSEILHPNEQGGTGEFREEQREVYFKYAVQKPIFGWTYAGFEMPNPIVDWWPPMSGQHFHEGYMEMLFYEGITGLLLKYWFLLYLSYKAFSKNLGQESVVLIAFSLGGLVFSFSYVLPLIFWGHVGLCLYYLEKKTEPAADEYEEELVTIQQLTFSE
jgi:hypothetical protein